MVFFYGNGRLVAFDLDGKSLWKRDLHKDYGEFAFLWTFSSSPLLFDGKLYIQVLQRDKPVGGRGLAGGEIESYLLALAPETGERCGGTCGPARRWPNRGRHSRHRYRSAIPEMSSS